MTELQQARADWLNELSKNVQLQHENTKLRQQVFELQSKLIASQTENVINAGLWKLALAGLG
jgi:hypothetical protein